MNIFVNMKTTGISSVTHSDRSFAKFMFVCNKTLLYSVLMQYIACVLNFVGKMFVFLVGKKIRGVLIFMAMAAW